MGDLDGHYKFFSHNFHGRNFYPRRNFDRKPKIEGVRKGKKSILEVKKFDFFRDFEGYTYNMTGNTEIDLCSHFLIDRT